MSRFTAIASSMALAFTASVVCADEVKDQAAEKPVFVVSSQSAVPTSLPSLGGLTVGGAVTLGVFGLIIAGAAQSSGSH